MHDNLTNARIIKRFIGCLETPFVVQSLLFLPAQKIGLRKEEIVILRSDSPEILSYLPRDLTVID